MRLRPGGGVGKAAAPRTAAVVLALTLLSLGCAKEEGASKLRAGTSEVPIPTATAPSPARMPSVPPSVAPPPRIRGESCRTSWTRRSALRFAPIVPDVWNLEDLPTNGRYQPEYGASSGGGYGDEGGYTGQHPEVTAGWLTIDDTTNHTMWYFFGFTKDAAAHLAQMRKRSQDPSHLRAFRAAFTVRDLVQLRERIVGDMTSLRRKGVDIDDAHPNAVLNRVVVTLWRWDPAQIHTVEERYGAPHLCFDVVPHVPVPPDARALPYYDSSYGFRPPEDKAAPQDGVRITGDKRMGCVWMVFPAAVGGHANPYAGRRAVLWPRGYFARFDPVRVYDRSGTEYWREGEVQPVEYAPFHSEYVERIPKQCRVGDEAAHDGFSNNAPN